MLSSVVVSVVELVLLKSLSFCNSAICYICTKKLKDPRLAEILKRTAEKAVRSPQLEILLKVRKADDPDFAFLQSDHVWHAYYQRCKEQQQQSKSSANDKSQSSAIQSLLSVYSSSSDDDVGDNDESVALDVKASPPTKETESSPPTRSGPDTPSNDDTGASESIGTKREVSTTEAAELRKARRLKRAKLMRGHFALKLMDLKQNNASLRINKQTLYLLLQGGQIDGFHRFSSHFRRFAVQEQLSNLAQRQFQGGIFYIFLFQQLIPAPLAFSIRQEPQSTSVSRAAPELANSDNMYVSTSAAAKAAAAAAAAPAVGALRVAAAAADGAVGCCGVGAPAGFSVFVAVTVVVVVVVVSSAAARVLSAVSAFAGWVAVAAAGETASVATGDCAVVVSFPCDSCGLVVVVAAAAVAVVVVATAVAGVGAVVVV
eukprot:CAMPEP_0116824532 /NCGR_PEP_ID=MMETSP0418-20121206/1452_1 /TAXON_ID=1158023 /ORGANISM="Astrosyne radiata, Strain 13vi08-1A" /LENGTH=429 /DNA_ID=CAMNT_0004452919 /DNA_START=494 /DNA_END=1783 /DNA_ORIENTATION=+